MLFLPSAGCWFCFAPSSEESFTAKILVFPLTMTQKQALKILKKGDNVFLTGAAGAGKTFVLNQYIEDCRFNNKEVAITASTGIAATHMQGMTIHSWSGVGIKEILTLEDKQRLFDQPQIRLRYLRTQVLIIDEVSMIAGYLLDMVNELAKFMRKSDQPFGGIQVIFCGDFFQLPPIVKNKDLVFAFESNAWQEANPRICYLEKNYRQSDNQLIEILTAIRTNSVTSDHIELLKERQDIALNDLWRPTKLFTHNVDVDFLNQQELDAISELPKTHYMQADGKKKFIEAVKKSCLAPEELTLKVGAIVMFVKNNLKRGYVNGTMGEVVDFTEEGNPIVQTAQGKEIVVVPEAWVIEDGDSILAQVVQLPLRLAWAITVHKSQGMSLDAAEIDLRKCFVPGMGYVALSRVRSLDGLSLLGFNQMSLSVDEKILRFDKGLRA